MEQEITATFDGSIIPLFVEFVNYLYALSPNILAFWAESLL